MQVFFYIGDVGKAKKKLTDNNVNLNDVIIGKSANEVHQFINKKITENKWMYVILFLDDYAYIQIECYKEWRLWRA